MRSAWAEIGRLRTAPAHGGCLLTCEPTLVPHQVFISIPESDAFNALLGKEREAEFSMQHALSHAKDSLHATNPVRKKLRLFVYHTHATQPRAPPAPGSILRPAAPPTGDVPSWTLHIVGRVMDADPPAAGSAAAAAAAIAAMSTAGQTLGGSGFAGASAAGAAGASSSAVGAGGQLALSGSSGPLPIPPPAPGAPGSKQHLGAEYFMRRVEVGQWRRGREACIGAGVGGVRGDGRGGCGADGWAIHIPGWM
jgi:hypothetical protein